MEEEEEGGGDSGSGSVVVVVLLVSRIGVGVALVVLFAEFRLDFPRGKSAIEIDSSIWRGRRRQ